MRFGDLGTLLVDRDGAMVPVVGRRLTPLLAQLLVRAGQRVSADVLIEACWGEDGMPAGAAFDTNLWRLRKLLEPDHKRGDTFQILINDAGGYRLLAAPDQVDSLRFDHAASALRESAASGPPDQVRRQAEQALALWRGSPWEPHTDEPWAAPAAHRLQELRAEVQQVRLRAMIDLGEAIPALADLEVLLAEHPLQESLWALRMLACHRSGRTDQALATYQRARETLLDELGLEPGPELQQLHTRILNEDPTLAATPPPQRAAAVVSEQPVEVRLPNQRVRLLGRDADASELSALVRQHPLVSLVGPAGCGKTSLSVQVARSLAAEFRDGVYFVDLTVAADTDQVFDTVSSTLRLPAAGTAGVPGALAEAARDRHALVVLDNCEHVLDPAAELLEAALGPDVVLRVLATSREPLEVDGEIVRPLRPLPVPLADREDRFDLDPESLDEQPAVALFIERLTAGRAGAAVDRAEVAAAARICAALDGLPLAIELAASQARSFTLAEIADRIRSDPSGLARVGRGGQRHHASLRGTIDRSWATLGDDEQAMHQAVSAVPGPFTAELAAALAEVSVPRAQELLSGLVHRSMLTPLGPRRPGLPSRFAQLATIRGHAIATLSDQQLAELDRRRNDWVRSLVDRQPEIGHRSELVWYQQLDNDLAAIRATLQACLVDRPDPTGAFVAARLGFYFYYRSMNAEWERWTGLGASASAGSPSDRLVCTISRVGALSFMARRGDGVDDITTGLADLDPSHRMLAGQYLLSVGIAAVMVRHYDIAAEFAKAGAQIAATTGSTVLQLLSKTAAACLRDPGVPSAERLQAVAELWDEAVTIDNLFVMQAAALVGTRDALNTGDLAGSLAWSDRCLKLYALLGDGASHYVIELRAIVLATTGSLGEAAELFAASEVGARRAGRAWPVYPSTPDLLDAVQTGLGVQEFAAAVRRGKALTVASIIGR